MRAEEEREQRVKNWEVHSCCIRIDTLLLGKRRTIVNLKPFDRQSFISLGERECVTVEEEATIFRQPNEFFFRLLRVGYERTAVGKD